MNKIVSLARWGACALALISVISVATLSPASAAGSSCLPASLKSKLSQIRAKFGPISIVSAHRPGARIAGTGKRSYHASCRAVDFHAPRGKHRQVVAWLKANHSGGVGTYSGGMHHIHIDNGSRVRFHKYVNGRGKRIGKRSKRRYASKRRNRRYSGKNRKSRYSYKKRSNSRKSRGYASKRNRTGSVKVVRSRSSIGRITAYSR